jgi:phage terminase large subunit-like protein
MTKRIGSQEPTQSLILPFKKTLGNKAIKLYSFTGNTVIEWQENLLNPIMAIDEDGLWVHTKFGYSLPRRNGKNEVLAQRELWGLVSGEKILHTAHRTTTSHMAWDRLCRLLDKAKIEYQSIKATGVENIRLETGGRIDFRTRSSKGGLGEGFDLLIIDEAQEYTDDENSALKYVVSDSSNPQTIFCGTPPTPLSSGTVFTNLRKTALNGYALNTGWAEWSVEEEAKDIRDKELWYATNPSLGFHLTERKIMDEVGDDIIDFNIQRLGLWIRYNQKSAISENEWNELKVDMLPKLKGKLFVGIKYGHDGTNVAMSIAVKTVDGNIFVEVIDCQSVRQGNDWVIAFLKQADIQEVVIDGASGQNILANEMKDARIKKPILPTVKEIIVANSTFEQGLFQQTLKHRGQPSLSQVVTNCDKRNIGSSGGFGYRSQIEENDIALMDSIILAFWAASSSKPVKKQKISY